MQLNCSRNSYPELFCKKRCEACKFIRKRPQQVFSCKFREIFKNACLVDYLRRTASGFWASVITSYDETVTVRKIDVQIQQKICSVFSCRQSQRDRGALFTRFQSNFSKTFIQLFLKHSKGLLLIFGSLVHYYSYYLWQDYYK